jgi:Ca2+-binding RTX toxin-like protein
VSYAWDLANDVQYDDKTGETVNVSAGSSSDPNDYEFPNVLGTYPISLRVTDGFGTTHTASTTLTIRERTCADSGGAITDTNNDHLIDATDGVTSGDDFIKGDGDKEKLRGLGGDDLICGEGGKDTLLGEAGDDKLFGGAGNDVVKAGEGSDELHGEADHDALYPGDDDVADDPIEGGAGSDGVYYSEPQRSASEPVNISLDGTADDGESGEGDNALSDVEKAQGGAGDDTLTGDADPNTLYGGPGGDTLSGEGGADTLFGELGGDKLQGGDSGDTLYPGHDSDPDDPISGGAGSDTVRYQDRSAAEPVAVSLNDTADDGGATEGDNVLSDVEKILAGRGEDTLVGSPFANVLDGGPGDDDITGGDAADSLYGREGDDVLHSEGDGVRDRDYCGTGGEDEGGDTAFADPIGTDLLYDCETRKFN